MGWAAMLRNEPYTGPTGTVELADEFLSDCRWRGLAHATLGGYRWALDRLISEFPELPLTPRELAAVLDDPSLAQESRRQLLKVLRLFYSWCAQEYGAPNPSELLGRIAKRRTLPRVLTGEEVHRLVDVASVPMMVLKALQVVFEVEAAMIDFLGVDNLSNVQGGRYSSDYGLKKAEEIAAMYEADELSTAEPIMLINLNRLYRRDMTVVDGEIYKPCTHPRIAGHAQSPPAQR